MNSALDDLILVIDWLASQKTPPNNIAAAFERLHRRASLKYPMDVRSTLIDEPDKDANNV